MNRKFAYKLPIFRLSAAFVLALLIGTGNGAILNAQNRSQPNSSATSVVTGDPTLNDLVEAALRDSREIRAAQKKYEASLDHRSVVSSLPDPRLSLLSASTNPLPG